MSRKFKKGGTMFGNLSLKGMKNMMPSFKRKPKTYDISDPEEVVHIEHIDFSQIQIDPNSPTGFVGLPDRWEKIINAGGFTKEDVEKHGKDLLPLVDFHFNGVNAPMPSAKAMKDEILNAVTIREENPEKFYRKMKKLGKGAGGEVWSAKRVSDNETVAVKIAPKPDPNNPDEKNNIMDEIALHALTIHANVVSLLDAFNHGTDIWVVLELMDGGDITSLCGKDMKWNEGGIAYVSQQVLQALESLHANFKLHRDIKSDNILYNTRGEVKIADFGFAAGLNTERKKRTSIVGTPYWMAPELIKAEDYDQRVDIWSLGITVLEMGDGQPPLIADTQPLRALLLITTSPSPTLKNKSAWSKDINHFLKVSLAKKPENRATSKVLLMHPFIMSAMTQPEFAKFTDELKAPKRERMERLKNEAAKVKPKSEDFDIFDNLYKNVQV